MIILVVNRYILLKNGIGIKGQKTIQTSHERSKKYGKMLKMELNS